MKHTPGPWYFDTNENYASKFRVYTETGGANVIWVDPDQESIEDGEANARLIAAAPELLKQLEYVKDMLRQLPHLKNPTIDLLAQQIEETLNGI